MHPRVEGALVSIRAPRAGSDLPGSTKARAPSAFQSALPARGATLDVRPGRSVPIVSIRAPRAGSDLLVSVTILVIVMFQSALPARGATRRSPAHEPAARFQSALPARGATRGPGRRHDGRSRFNPRSPRGERRSMSGLDGRSRLFQSALPARGATRQAAHPRRGRRVSIRAPRAGSDHVCRDGRCGGTRFNPRSPRGERPAHPAGGHRGLLVSIRAPRAGSDQSLCLSRCMPCGFNPRSPRGERLGIQHRTRQVRGFQSALPARGATLERRPQAALFDVSIRAPRAGSDARVNTVTQIMEQFQSALPARGATGAPCQVQGVPGGFNPRSPRGERQQAASANCNAMKFQSALPARGATFGRRRRSGVEAVSIRAPRAGSDAAKGRLRPPHVRFNPRSPRGERRR